MASSFTWPGSLPRSPSSYSETGGVLLLRSPMDAGPAKVRRRGRMPETMSVEYVMTSVQLTVFEGFVQDTIRGTMRFGFPHPRRKITVDARIVPESGGKLYSISFITESVWSVSIVLEVLP